MYKAFTYSLPNSGAVFTSSPGWGVTVDNGVTRLAQPQDNTAFIMIPTIENGKIKKGTAQSSIFEAILSEVSLEINRNDAYDGDILGYSVGTKLTFKNGLWKKIDEAMLPCYWFGEVIKSAANKIIVYFKGSCRAELME
jgi:hypothetical protein